MASQTKKSQPAVASPSENSAKQASLRTSVEDIQKFTSFVKNIATSDEYNALADLVDKASKLEVEVKDLHKKLEQEKKSHDNIQSGSLETYSQKFTSMEKDKQTLNEQINSLQLAVAEKDRAMSQLTSLKVQLENRAEISKRNYAESQSKLEAMQTECARLSQQLKTSQTAFITKSDALTAAQSEVNRLRKVEKLSQAMQSDLEHLQMFAVPFADCKLEPIIKGITDLWRSLKETVTRFVEVDLPQGVLEDGCARLESAWPHGIPLPATNTATAKSMRVAVVLGLVARLFDEHILQPTYIKDERGYLRSLLVELAVSDHERAIYLRRILLAVLPKVQEENSEEKVDEILEVLKRAGVHTVILPENEEDFEEAIVSLCDDMQALWEPIQKSSHTLEPVFDINHSNFKRWYNLRLWDDYSKQDKKVQKAIPEGEAWSIHSPVIIPQIWAMVPSPGKPSPVMPGAVLLENEMLKARLELQNAPKTTGPLGRRIGSSRNTGGAIKKRRDSAQTSSPSFLVRGDDGLERQQG